MIGENVLVIIPARGGSKGIPKKNLRWLAGKPLIAHVIDAALAIPDVRVLVSTEDLEIAGVATRYGADVIKRPDHLADDFTTLDDVVLHAWDTYGRSNSDEFDVVVTLQPTSPLVSTETIMSVIEMLRKEKLDCCITVTDARHLYWIEKDGEPTPVYSERLNRQWLPPFWKETGAVVATRAVFMSTERKRIGGRIGLFRMPEEEAVDIDSWDDWYVAENRLNRPRIVFRVTGNRKTGLGHAYRVMTLARRMFVPDLTIAVNSDSQLALELMSRENLSSVIVHDDEDFLRLVREGGYDLVINDILDTEEEYVTRLKGNNERVVVNFEDLGPGSLLADLTINALYEYSTPEPNQRFGWQYVCLRDEFILPRLRDDVNLSEITVVVSFGGTDPNDLTGLAIRAAVEAARIVGPFRLIVIVGPGNTGEESHRHLIEDAREWFTAVEYHRDVRNMSDLMSKATFAVTSNGRTVYEFASLGVPMITISQNMREVHHTFGRFSGGVIDLGLAGSVSIDALARAMSKLHSDPERRESMRRRLLAFDLKSGVDRVLEEIDRVYREWKRSRLKDQEMRRVRSNARVLYW